MTDSDRILREHVVKLLDGRQAHVGMDSAINKLSLDDLSRNSEATPWTLWELFEHILWISGAYATEEKGFISITPFFKMPKDRRAFIKHKPQPNVGVELIKLGKISSFKSYSTCR